MLIDCPSCQKKIAETAPACPQCGHTIFVEHPADLPRDATAVEKFKEDDPKS